MRALRLMLPAVLAALWLPSPGGALAEIIGDARVGFTAERILIDPACYDGPGTAEVLPPKPLGRMARKLEEITAMPVERRPVDLYAALAEVAR